MKTALVWFRRDLRLADNPALHHALDAAERILPVYVHGEPQKLVAGAASRWWLHHSLAALGADLHKRGAPLVIRRGDPAQVLVRLAGEVGAGAVCWNRRYEPAQRRQDQAVEQALTAAGLEVQTFNGALLAEPWSIATGEDKPYRVYTPFSRKLLQLGAPRDPLPAPRRLAGVDASSDPLESLELRPTIQWDGGLDQTWTPGEAGARQRLDRFCRDALAGYKAGRERPDRVGSSLLSPHLHFGEIGPVQLLARLRRESAERHESGLAAGVEVFEREIVWREFAHHVLHHFPDTDREPMNPRYRAFPWRTRRDYASDLRRWQRGQTGVPIVDAGMRQLWTTGWMHNRVRMIVASYLVKNLLVPWQEGAAWFWDCLVDADLANNSLGWQWVAGSGADAAPYFRVFNPVTQAQKFDPDGTYVRHWVPEIARLSDKALHAPWLADPAELARCRLQLDQDYPLPSVDLGESRTRALEAFARVRGSGGG